MRGVPNPELKAECVRLRVEERLSLREIHEKAGAAKGSLSNWLKPYPLTHQELADRQKRIPRGFNKKDRGEKSAAFILAARPLTKHHKAKIAEAAVLFRLTLKGMAVFGSPFDGDKTDWLVEVPCTNRIVRIQVKWTLQMKSTLPGVSLRCADGRYGNKRYQKGDFDFIVGYDLFTDTCYVWSWDEVEHLRNMVTVCPEAAERWDKLIGE